MAFSLASLVPGLARLTTVLATYYTAPGITSSAPNGTSARITSATLVNSTASLVNATVYLAPPGMVAAIENVIIYNKPIQPGESYNCPELVGKVIVSGASLQALASVATSISFNVSGVTLS